MSPLKVILLVVAGVGIFVLLPLAVIPFLELSFPQRMLLLNLPAVVVLIVVFLPVKKRNISVPGLIYNDRHVEIYTDRLVISGYIFGPLGRLTVRLDEIAGLEIIHFKRSCWRLQGTGDFKTWYAQDLKRNTKKENFLLESRRFKGRVGFSVEDFEKVSAIFREKGLLPVA